MSTFCSIPKSTPSKFLEIALNIMPLTLHCQKEGLLAFIRLKGVLEFGWLGSSRQKTYANSHMKFWTGLADAIEGTSDERDRVKEVVWERNFHTDITSNPNDIVISHDGCNIYSDGSKIDERVGAGFIVLENKVVTWYENVRLPDSATVFQAEIVAIRLAATHARNKTNVNKFLFFIDSQAAILALKNPTVSSNQVKLAKRELNTLGLRAAITLCWTKAHVGTLGNELADQQAKQGGQRNSIMSIGLPDTELKGRINERFLEFWKEKWNEYSGARMSKIFFNGPEPNKAKHLIKLSSYKLGRLLRLLSGHNRLNYFQSLIDPSISPLCRLCEEEDETFHHWVEECPVLRQHRTDIFKVATNSYVIVPNKWSVAELIKFSFLDVISSVINFGVTFDGAGSLTDHSYVLEPD